MNKYIFCLLALLSFAPFSSAQDLKKCWDKHVKPLKGKVVSYSFSGTENYFNHGWTPWRVAEKETKGTVYLTDNKIYISDVDSSRIKIYLDDKKAISVNGEDGLLYQYPKGSEMYESLLLTTARYTPTLLINYLLSQKNKLNVSQKDNFTTYKLSTKYNNIRVFVDNMTNRLMRFSALRFDNSIGDYDSNIEYQIDIESQNPIFSLDQVLVNCYGGRIQDYVLLSDIREGQSFPDFNDKKIIEVDQSVDEIDALQVYNYNNRLHFVSLPKDESQSLIVEFDNFMAVIEAPNTSENGELIVAEAKKIAADKPIRYFMFSHHHPHYLGGFRPFVHKGATVVTIMDNFDYVSFLAKNKRTLKPDSLQHQPKRLDIEIMDKVKTISDGSYEMQMHVIGEKSEHTQDYTIFYFPAEKLIFQGDLVWIPKNGNGTKVSKRQKGLYYAIKELNLDVETIVQSWDPQQYNIKSIISFSELENSVFAK